MNPISKRIVSALTLACLVIADARLRAEEPSTDSGQTNIVLRISRELIRKHQAPAIDETTPIDRFLFGSHVTGTAHTSGQSRVEMETNEKDAVFTLHFKGSTSSRTLATRRPVVVHSSSTTEFDATREVHFDGVRFKADGATISASTASTINRVDTPPGLLGCVVRRIAWREIDRTKPLGDEIALTEVKRRVLASFDAETEQLVKQLNGIVPYEYAIAFLAPKTKDWINHLGTTKEYLIISPGKKDWAIATLPKEAKQMRAPLEFWMRGRPQGESARLLLERFTSAQRALDRFRSAVTGKERKLEGVTFTAVGDWWVLKVGEDLLEQWLEKIGEKSQQEKRP